MFSETFYCFTGLLIKNKNILHDLWKSITCVHTYYHPVILCYHILEAIIPILGIFNFSSYFESKAFKIVNLDLRCQ